MAKASLIASIDSAVIRIKGRSGIYFGGSQDADELKIGLRTLKALLLVSTVMKYRPLGGCLNVLLPCLRNVPKTLASLLVRIHTVLDIIIHGHIDAQSMVKKVRLLAKDLDCELSNATCRPSSFTAVDEVVGITDSVLENASDFLSLILEVDFKNQTAAFEAIDTFQVNMRFAKSVLLFAGRASVELQNALMFRIQPIAINAARVFIMDNADRSHYQWCEQWCEDIGSKCLMVNRLATDPHVYQAYSHALNMATLSSSTALCIGDDILKSLLDSLISVLWEELRHCSNSVIKDEFKVLYEKLRFLRAVLKQQESSLGEVISSQVVLLICDAGVLICSFYQSDPGRLSDLLLRFDGFRDRVVALEANFSMEAIGHELSFGDYTTIQISCGDEMQIETPMPIHQPPPHRSTPQVFGYHDDEVAMVLDRLIGGSNHLRIVPICGMAGLGKTTFALQLYNHPSVLHHFWAHAWCPISQQLDKKKVLLQLLNQIQQANYSDMNEEDLANKLRQCLKGRRYLILLDDVWCPRVLDSLKASFPDDFNGSRIILTSRCVDISPHHLLPDGCPHLLRLREDSECLDILHAKLSHKDGWNLDLGMEVAKICKGLPLTLVIVSGLLATTEQEGWKAILDHLSSGRNISGAEQCTIALESGYKHLPDYLQPCFLYFAAFPEDEEVSVKTLIRLWMAEGFVMKNELKRIEDVGQEYMEKLIERSLVMVGRNRSIGGAKTCRIHDLLHGFCQSKAKQEGLLHLLLPMHDQLSGLNEPCNLQRLSIHSVAVAGDFKSLRLFYPSALSLLFFFGEFRNHSHLFDMIFIIQIFQILKVLHMDEIVLINGIPTEIELLTRLTYLSICTLFPTIPSSVGNLSNLETFSARILQLGTVAFPHTLWNLQKLKYLYIRSHSYGLFLPAENLENSSSLLELETLGGVIFRSDGCMEKQMEKFPNIRRLKCTFEHSRKWKNSVGFEVLTQIQSLSLRLRNASVRCEFGSITENLKKLKLEGFELSRKEIAVIGKFPNLEVLKLSLIRFPDHTLEMEGEEFPKLRFLLLYMCSNLESWTTSDDELQSLQKLDFWCCAKLQEIPSWLEASSTLEEIQVFKCTSALESLVRDIEEVQKDYGSLVKVRIVS